MFNFGAATIKWNGSDLGKTFEGGSLSPNLQVIEDVDIEGNLFYQEILNGGKGEINFYEWNDSISLSNDTTLEDWGTLEIVMPKMTITIWEAKLFIDLDSLGFGTNNQKGFKVKFVFRKDSQDRVIDLGG